MLCCTLSVGRSRDLDLKHKPFEGLRFLLSGHLGALPTRLADIAMSALDLFIYLCFPIQGLWTQASKLLFSGESLYMFSLCSEAKPTQIHISLFLSVERAFFSSEVLPFRSLGGVLPSRHVLVLCSVSNFFHFPFLSLLWVWCPSSRWPEWANAPGQVPSLISAFLHFWLLRNSPTFPPLQLSMGIIKHISMNSRLA